MLKKLFAALVASLAAPFWGGAMSLVANASFDASLGGVMALLTTVCIGVLPATVGAQLQAPPYTFFLFWLLGTPLLSYLGRNRRLKPGSVLLVGILLGVILAFFYEYFPGLGRNYLPFVPREHILLADFWALFTGVTGTFLLWYIAFDSREG